MQIAVIGNNADGCTPVQYEFARELGLALVDDGHTIICGGLGGVMEGVCQGARKSIRYHHGVTVGLLPGYDKKAANKYVDVVIPTGLGYARNVLVANSGDAVIAIGGGTGTLTEIAYAWHQGIPIIACTQFGGWSEQLGGKQLDHRQAEPIRTATSIADVRSHLSALQV